MGSVSAGAVDQLGRRNSVCGLEESGVAILSHRMALMQSIRKVLDKDMYC